MKKFTILTFFLIALLSQFSCRRASDNGKIDGNWKIYDIYYTDDGTSYSPENEFIAIQLELIQLRGGPIQTTGVISYDKGDDEMYVDFRSNPKPEQLKPYGFSDAQSVVHIDKADGKRLVLTTPIAKISCRKY